MHIVVDIARKYENVRVKDFQKYEKLLGKFNVIFLDFLVMADCRVNFNNFRSHAF